MSANVLRAGGQPFPFFCVECANGWMIPLQYVNTKEQVWLFRVADPSRFWKGRVLFLPLYRQR